MNPDITFTRSDGALIINVESDMTTMLEWLADHSESGRASIDDLSSAMSFGTLFLPEIRRMARLKIANSGTSVFSPMDRYFFMFNERPGDVKVTVNYHMMSGKHVVSTTTYSSWDYPLGHISYTKKEDE